MFGRDDFGLDSRLNFRRSQKLSSATAISRRISSQRHSSQRASTAIRIVPGNHRTKRASTSDFDRKVMIQRSAGRISQSGPIPVNPIDNSFNWNGIAANEDQAGHDISLIGRQELRRGCQALLLSRDVTKTKGIRRGPHYFSSISGMTVNP